MSKQKKVLIACLADPAENPRPRRAIELCLSMGMSVSVLSYSPKGHFPFEVDSFFVLSSLSYSFFAKLMRRILALLIMACPFESYKNFFESLRLGFHGLKGSLCHNDFDVVITENLYLLPLVFAVKGKTKVLFDAREYYPKQNEESVWFNFIEKSRRVQLCQNYMARCDAVVTVSEGLRKAFKEEFGISSVLYRSAPSYVDTPVRLTDKEHIKMVYHGAANRNRQLEKLIEVLGLLDGRFSLDFFLVGNDGYQSELKKVASNDSRIRFIEPVVFSEIIPTISKYDIGLFYCEPSTFNLKHCLPNKFFEYIQARVMVAIGPSPDMAQLVKKYGCGVVSEAFSVESMAEALNGLSVEDIDRAKRCSDIAARELCFEEESKVMKGIIQNLIGE